MDTPLPPGTHRLRVADREGRPVARVRLTLWFADADRGGPGAVVDATTIDAEALVPAGADVARIDARPLDPGDPPLLPRTGILPAPGVRDHRIVLDRGDRLRVRVVVAENR